MYDFTDIMRTPRNRQNRFLQPLDELLGTQANVRLLRVLALRRTPLTAGELARIAALGRTSVYPALRQLEGAGIVEFVGAGAQRLIQLRDRHPLSTILKDLFRAESRQFEALTNALRDLLADLPHRLMSAWIDERPDDAQSAAALRLYIVARPEELEPITDHLDTHLAEVEREYDIHIALQELTRSELEKLHTTSSANLDTVSLVAGVPPLALVNRSRHAADDPTFASHDEHDARSWKLALAIAAKIKRDPGLIGMAEDHVKARAQKASPRERRELAEWLRIFSTMSPARLRKFLVENSERAIRLRQTLPALRLLSPAEREAVLRSRTDAEVITAVTKR
jgi:DNA-binding transcriptional regulator GbsR (MarR family)